MKSSDLGLLFTGSFLIVDSIWLPVISLFKLFLFVSYWISFGKIYVSRRLPISSLLFNLWHITVHSSLLWFLFLLAFFFFFFLHFCAIGCYFSSFTSYCVYLDLLSFLLGKPSYRFVNFVYLFKNQALSFAVLFLFVLTSSLLISFPIFIISFFLLTLGSLCSFFLMLLCSMFGSLFEIFLVS